MNTFQAVDTIEIQSMDTHELLKRYAAGERDFSGILLTRTDLSGAYLSGANLSQADINGAFLVGDTSI